MAAPSAQALGAPAARLAANAFDAFPGHIAVLDEQGIILLVNEAWRRFAARSGAVSDFTGQSYVAVCEGPPGDDHPGSEIIAGMRGVLRGELESFDLEYPCHAPGSPACWFRMQVIRFDRPQEGGALLVLHEDITRRREAEEALRESEQRLRLALQAASTGLWDWEIETDRVAWSPECFAIHGVHEGDFGHSAADFRRRIHPEDQDRVWQAVNAAIETHQTYECEFRIVRPDGQLRWIANYGRAFYDEHGRPARMIGTIIDITPRKASEQILRESEHRLRLVLEASATGIWEWDVRTHTVSWSDECYRIHGLREDEFDGTADAFDRTLHPDDRDRVWAAVTAATRDRARYECEFRILRPGGEVRWVANVGRALYDERGQPTRMIGTLTDITPRKQAEQVLRDSEERYRHLFESNPNPMWVYDLDSLRFLAVNDAAVAHYGYSRDEFLAMTIKDIRPPEEIPRLLDRIRAVGAGLGQPGVWRHRTKDGRLIDVQVTSHALHAHGSRTALVLAQDITLQRRAEAALQRSNQELNRFASFASHDLKEPLRGVGTLARFMLQDEPHLSPEGTARLQRIDELCQRLTAMIEALLEYARSGGEHRRLPCDLNHIVHRAADTLAEVLRSGNVELSIGPGLPTIPGDPALLERVFANLIANAVKYNTSARKRIWIGREDGDIIVRDNGVGIPERHQQRIFELFARVPGSPSSEGIGLGLALVKTIVESHGGQISVQSTPGQGSTFRLRFPGSL